MVFGLGVVMVSDNGVTTTPTKGPGNHNKIFTLQPTAESHIFEEFNFLKWKNDLLHATGFTISRII
jgi:hypothetical protein